MGDDPTASKTSTANGGKRPPFPAWRKWVSAALVAGLVVLQIAMFPMHDGQRDRANDKAAESRLRSAFAAATIIFGETGDYSEISSESLATVEPALTFVTTDSTGSFFTVSWDVRTTSTPDDTIDLAARSASGACFYLEDVSDAGTTLGGRESGQGVCAGTDAAGPSGGWGLIERAEFERKWSLYRWIIVAVAVTIAVLVFAPRRPLRR